MAGSRTTSVISGNNGGPPPPPQVPPPPSSTLDVDRMRWAVGGGPPHNLNDQYKQNVYAVSCVLHFTQHFPSNVL